MASDSKMLTKFQSERHPILVALMTANIITAVLLANLPFTIILLMVSWYTAFNSALEADIEASFGQGIEYTSKINSSSTLIPLVDSVWSLTVRLRGLDITDERIEVTN